MKTRERERFPRRFNERKEREEGSKEKTTKRERKRSDELQRIEGFVDVQMLEKRMKVGKDAQKHEARNDRHDPAVSFRRVASDGSCDGGAGKLKQTRLDQRRARGWR